ncbi:nucleoside-triphosphatase [Garciella nitratireducens]|uniref:Nucleoside-triphosphatase n=1 Tax=Garciella nitratireducens DSM 15102 TaxID=1121911 RepID=A0A1T4NGK4_9FIRM|nr:nucleoside-triphosphatase [Garciella nitratireducens]SJZ78400.1 nucleoside-triphosphatase [Garciella nitratireducens DSM 15102]
MKHVFLSGNIGIGKSTIIQKLIRNLNLNQEKIGGFYTKAYIKGNELKGFYLEPIHIHYNIPNIQDRLIGYKLDGGDKWISVKDTFENLGVRVLKECMKGSFDLIILDELGFFENDCLLFQKKIHEVLSSGKRVIGVIKPFSTPFIDSIRIREDVMEVEVTKDNRQGLIKYLTNQFRQRE